MSVGKNNPFYQAEVQVEYELTAYKGLKEMTLI